MHLRSLDLNLAVVLQALFEEGSVTAAARRLGLSQSATSHALARLRETLADPLFVRTPSGLVPTARAQSMREGLARGLAEIERTLQREARFDPATATGTFRIGTSDYTELVAMPSLLTRLATSAPNLDTFVVTAPREPDAALAAGEIDLALAPHVERARGAGGIYTADLWSDRFLVVMRKGHPLARGKLTVARYAAARHAFVAPRGSLGGAVDGALAERGLQRRVAFVTPNFLVAPQVVATTDLVITLAARVALAFAARLPLVLREPPLPLPDFRIAMTWHARKHDDPAHRFLRSELSAVARGVSVPSKRMLASAARSR